MRRSNLKAIGFVLAFLLMAAVGLLFGRILAGGEATYLSEPVYPIN